MLADPRAEALATRFAAQWLRLNDVDEILPDALLYPYYDHSLGQAFKRETELFFDSLVREDRSVLDLLTADYTFVNERIARHYGIPNVTGTAFQRVTVPDYRRGILGHGSVLTLTSVADRTSPVMRGKWVMEVLLGSPPPPPPPNVPAFEDTKAAVGGKLLSVRERMEEHRKNPACTSCHRVIDPLGLALDNFDVTGKWRIKDNGVPVDASGDDVRRDEDRWPAGLRNALLKHKDALLLSFTERLMTYALGRRIEAVDMPAVRAIVQAAAPGTATGCPRSFWASCQRRVSVDAAATSRATAVNHAHPTHRPLSRRTVLKGMGVTIALPLLEAMVPRGGSAAQAHAAATALVAIEMVHGSAGAPRSGSRRTCGRRRRSARIRSHAERASARSSRIATTSPSSATPTCATPKRSRRRRSAAITSARRPCS